jgi:hypothetical protein
MPARSTPNDPWARVEARRKCSSSAPLGHQRGGRRVCDSTVVARCRRRRAAAARRRPITSRRATAAAPRTCPVRAVGATGRRRDSDYRVGGGGGERVRDVVAGPTNNVPVRPLSSAVARAFVRGAPLAPSRKPTLISRASELVLAGARPKHRTRNGCAPPLSARISADRSASGQVVIRPVRGSELGPIPASRLARGPRSPTRPRNRAPLGLNPHAAHGRSLLVCQISNTCTTRPEDVLSR